MFHAAKAEKVTIISNIKKIKWKMIYVLSICVSLTDPQEYDPSFTVKIKKSR